MKWKIHRSFDVFAWIAISILAFGCASSKVNWDSRIGNFNFDQAVIELGPPERSAQLSDGRTVAEWLTYRGRYVRSYPYYSPGYSGYWSPSDAVFPDRYLRLTFSPEGRLEDWKNVTK